MRAFSQKSHAAARALRAAKESEPNMNRNVAPEPAPSAAAARQTFYGLSSLVLAVVILHFGRVVLMPFVLAVLLTFVLVPVVTRLERLGIGRLAAVMIILSLGLATTLSLGWMVEQRIAGIAFRWPEYQQSLREKSRALLEWSDRLEKHQNEIRETFGGGLDGRTATNAPGDEFGPRTSRPSSAPIPVRVVPEKHSPLAALSNYGAGVITPLASALLVATMLAFMLLRWELVRDRVLLLIGASPPGVVDRTVKEAANRVSRVLIAQCAINGCFAAMTALGLWIIHWTLGGHASLPIAIAAGILCGLLRFVPYVGVWIGAGLPLLHALAAYSSNAVFYAALGMFVVLEILTAQIAEPRWLGAKAGISPPGILISTVFWTWIWGPAGLLLATPLTVLLVVMGKHIPALRHVYILLADRHAMGLSRRTAEDRHAGPAIDH